MVERWGQWSFEPAEPCHVTLSHVEIDVLATCGP